MSPRMPAMALIALTAIWVGGCSGEAPDAGAGEQSPGTAELQLPPSRTLAVPGQESAPSPHEATRSPHDLGIFWEVPDGWVKEPPASSMRIAQYGVGGPGGDAECVVFYFGPGMGGDASSNATRWAMQFEQPDGRPSTEVMRVSELPGGKVRVRIVEVTGTYDGGMAMTGAAEKKPGYMLLGGIADGPDAPWFFKFTGPEATIQAQREAFLGMMRTVGGGD